MANLTNQNGTNSADTLTYNKAGTYHANAGNDTIKIDGGGGIVVYTTSGNNNITVIGGSGHTIKVAVNNADSDKQNGVEKLIVNGADQIDGYLGAGKDEIALLYTDGKKTTGALSQIHGGAWTDTFNIGNGAKGYQLYGDAGDDVFTIKNGDNIVCWGGAANDTFNVTGGTNIKLRGGDSADYYNILADSVDMQLGYGNDTVAIEGGNNHKIKANLGINTISIMAGSGHVITADIDQAASKKVGKDVGYGQDTLGIYGSASKVTANLGDGRDTVIVGTGSYHYIYTEGWSDTITVDGQVTDSVFNGGAGDDTITLENGSNNVLYGGAGKDTITVNAANNVVYGDHSSARSYKDDPAGSSYNDTIIVNKEATDCKVYAGRGDNYIELHSARCKVMADSGADTVVVKDEEGTANVELYKGGTNLEISTDEGNDRITIDCGKDYRRGTFYYHSNYITVSAGAGDDVIRFDRGEHEDPCASFSYAFGGSGNDQFILDAAKITAYGGNGNDSFVNYTDIYKGGNYMVGGAGNDTYYFDFTKGLEGDNAYYIDNTTHRGANDKDVLKLVGYKFPTSNIEIRGRQDNTDLVILQAMDPDNTTHSLNIFIKGFDTLSDIVLCDSVGRPNKSLGSGLEFFQTCIDEGHFKSTGFSFSTAEEVLKRESYFNRDYLESVQLFAKKDLDLQITGNGF